MGVTPAIRDDSSNWPRRSHIASWAAIQVDENGSVKEFGTVVDLADIPAMQRRRLNDFGRIAVQCALGVIPEGDFDVVFASRHGDAARTAELVVDASGGAPLSPMNFSLSVHNAIAGLIDLISGCRHGHTALSAVKGLVSIALIDAHLRLFERPRVPIVLVIADGPIPDIYEEVADREADSGLQALAICISGESHPADLATCEICRPAMFEENAIGTDLRAAVIDPGIGELVRWFAGTREERFAVRDSAGVWALRGI